MSKLKDQNKIVGIHIILILDNDTNKINETLSSIKKQNLLPYHLTIIIDTKNIKYLEKVKNLTETFPTSWMIRYIESDIQLNINETMKNHPSPFYLFIKNHFLLPKNTLSDIKNFIELQKNFWIIRPNNNNKWMMIPYGGYINLKMIQGPLGSNKYEDILPDTCQTYNITDIVPNFPK